MAPPDVGAAGHLVDRKVATPTKRERSGQGARARRRQMRATRRIESAARERHDTWSQVGIPVAVTAGRLTAELDDLYADKRRRDER